MADRVAGANAVQPQVLAQAFQHQHVLAASGLIGHRRDLVLVGEVDERLVDDDQVPVGQRVEEAEHGAAGQARPGRVVRVAHRRRAGSDPADEGGEGVHVQPELLLRLQGPRTHPLADLFGLIGPAAERRHGGGQAVLDQ